ncbi:MAG: hypothetical protein NTW21_15045 [Verrucomicrobia bacterium]|nr:hypothetical protein [Verrucomicrobiota bacterium]
MFEVLFEFLAEVVLQVIVEALFELGLQSLSAPFRRKPSPWLATLGYTILGAVAGGLSLWVFPTRFIAAPAGRLANLVLTPLAAGAVMAALGAWRRRRDQDLIRLDRFAFGFLFALAMTLVRFAYGR